MCVSVYLTVLQSTSHNQININSKLKIIKKSLNTGILHDKTKQ